MPTRVFAADQVAVSPGHTYKPVLQGWTADQCGKDGGCGMPTITIRGKPVDGGLPQVDDGIGEYLHIEA